jgi:hypothetical protein
MRTLFSWTPGSLLKLSQLSRSEEPTPRDLKPPFSIPRLTDCNYSTVNRHFQQRGGESSRRPLISDRDLKFREAHIGSSDIRLGIEAQDKGEAKTAPLSC